jgi:hypothetical protein
VAVALADLPEDQQGCQVYLVMPERGAGKVRIKDMEASCPTCTRRLPGTAGDRVRLEAVPAEGSYFAGWEGQACRGLEACDIVSHREPVKVVARFLPRTLCTHGWCWRNPLPSGGELRGLWGTSGNDLWAVGTYGAILHWDGTLWTPFTGLCSEEAAQDGDPPDTLCAGNPKRRAFTADLDAIWGSGKNDIWAVGAQGAILHFSNGSWVPLAKLVTTQLRAVWGTSAKEVWAAGDGGVLLRWNGTQWAREEIGGVVKEQFSAQALWASGPDDLWLAGPVLASDDGRVRVLRRQKGRWEVLWTAASLFDRIDRIDALWGSGPDDVRAVGEQRDERNGVVLGLAQRWNGKEWRQSRPVPSPLHRVWGTGRSDVWVTGMGGYSARWEAREPEDVLVPFSTGSSEGLRGLWGLRSDAVWALEEGGGRMMRWNGVFWLPTGVRSGSTSRIHALWGGSAMDGRQELWAGGMGGTLLGWTGSSFADASPGTMRGALTGIWGSTTDDVWAVGWTVPNRGVLLHKGRMGGWQDWGAARGAVYGALYGIWGSASDDIWAVGTDGTILRWNGSTWSPFRPAGLDLSAQTFQAVTGTARDDVWILSARGDLLHVMAGGRAALRQAPSGMDPALTFTGIWAGPGTVLWITAHDPVRRQGRVLRVRSQPMELLEEFPLKEGPIRLNGVWGTPDGSTVWVVGNRLHHWDGRTLCPVLLPTSGDLYAVWASPAGEVWVAGGAGIILHHDPKAQTGGFRRECPAGMGR